MSGSNILFVLTGSIAGFKACEAVSHLMHRVRPMATATVPRFAGATAPDGDPAVWGATRRTLAGPRERRLATTFLLPQTSTQPLHVALS